MNYDDSYYSGHIYKLGRVRALAPLACILEECMVFVGFSGSEDV